MRMKIGSLESFFLYQLYLLKKWEERKFACIERIIVLNQKDSELVKKITNDDKKIEIDYPKISEAFYSVIRSPEKIENGAILFWGAMNRKENEDAILWFYENIFPDIQKKIPSSKLYIVGANPTEKIKQLSSDHIIVTGFINNPLCYFEKAQVSVVPLRHGAGIKIKVLEALAAKIPVVSTSVGAEGILSSDGLLHITDDVKSFSKKVIELIS